MHMQTIKTTFTNDGFPSMRYVSGKIIYDEAFLDGRLLSRYWTDTGQIVPELYLTADSLRRQSGEFNMEAFELKVNGKKLDNFEYVLSGEKQFAPEADPTGLRSRGKVKCISIIPVKASRLTVSTSRPGVFMFVSILRR
jgi:hypothetical protein